MSADGDRNLLACRQCGLLGTGNYCRQCGAPLKEEEESLSGEVQSKLTGPVVSMLSFVKTTWLVAFSPRRFFGLYFGRRSPELTDLTFPLAGAWGLVSSRPQKVMRPFQSLATGLALIALVGAMQASVWRLTGLADALGPAIAESEQRTIAWYERTYGQKLVKIDTGRLTGFDVIDAPARQVFQILLYTWFAVLVLMLLGRKEPTRPDRLHYYVYGMSAALALFFILNLVGMVVFVLLVGVSLDAALGFGNFVGGVIGHLPKIYFLAILPSVIFPEVLAVTRTRVVLATAAGALLWMAINAILVQLTLFTFGLLIV